MILPVTTTFTMPTGLEKLEFTVEYKNKQGKVRRSFYDIDQKFFRHFISGTYQEEGTKKLAEIFGQENKEEKAGAKEEAKEPKEEKKEKKESKEAKEPKEEKAGDKKQQ